MFTFTFADAFSARIVTFRTSDWCQGLERAARRSVDGLCVVKDDRGIEHWLDFSSKGAKAYGWMYA